MLLRLRVFTRGGLRPSLQDPKTETSVIPSIVQVTVSHSFSPTETPSVREHLEVSRRSPLPSRHLAARRRRKSRLTKREQVAEGLVVLKIKVHFHLS